MTDYVALTGIMAPNTNVYGYQRGDRVHESVVSSWNLRIGTDVEEGAELPAEVTSAPAVRPGAESTRADWEKWAVVNGMSEQDAAAASQDDLEAADGTSEQGDRPERPADSAPKAEWQAYAVALGADEMWARDSATTKANLQAYEPPVGDTVAVAATEANQA
jgi:hypothetical protein